MTGWNSQRIPDVRLLATPGVGSQHHAPAANAKLLLTVNEAAHRLGIGRSLMYELIRSGQVESIRVGRLRRVPAESLDDYIASRRTARSRQPPTESDLARSD